MYYDYGGFAANTSYGIPVVDTTISLGVVRNVYEPVDFKGEFDALYTYNILKVEKLQQLELVQEQEKRLHLFRS